MGRHRRRGVHLAPRHPGERVAAQGIWLGGLLAVHAPGHRRRRPARRPLAAVRQDRMRAAPVVTTQPPILLVAHGSRDPRAGAAIRALRRDVASTDPERPVGVAFLDHERPTVPSALTRFVAAGHSAVVVQPLLLTSAYHDRVDLPALLAEARAAGCRARVAQAEVLGPRRAAVDAKLVVALRRRLAEIRRGYDCVVLAAAGTRDRAAQATVDT